MDVIAHRGMSGTYPENTMLAFRKAYEAGADGIELDVHLSRDGEVMIMHDESLKRTAGIDSLLMEHTRAELESISAGKTKDDSYGFTPVPSLEEYLSWVKDTGLYTNIELKTAPLYYPGIEEKTAALIRRFSLEDRIIISSFNWMSVMRMKEIAPELRYALLFSGLDLKRMGALFSDMGMAYYHPDQKLLSDELIEDLHAHGVAVNAWTVNDEERMRWCLEHGCDGVITNFPDIARRVVDDSKRS